MTFERTSSTKWIFPAKKNTENRLITNQLLERARGNFLWVRLAVQRINGCHTKVDVARALDDLPAGMEALYDRMAASIQLQPNSGDRRLGLSILGWAVCARWALSVEELSDALDNSGLLEIHRTIGDLCGGFVVVDVEGHVAMIHETAREYLIRENHRQSDRPFTIDTLARLAKSDYLDHNSDLGSDVESPSTMLSIQIEYHSVRVDKVIAIAGQSVGPLYCYGTEDGVAVLCEAGKGKVGEVERLQSFMSIEQLTWIEDGRYVAVSDLNGKVSIKKISKSSLDREAWETKHEFHVVIPPHEGQICQLLFDPSGGEVLAATEMALHKIDLTSRCLVQSVPFEGSGAKWVCHPTLPEYFIGFREMAAHLLRWKDLDEVEVHTYSSLEHSAPTIPNRRDR